MTIFRFRSARRGKSVDSADLSAMATVFPGVTRLFIRGSKPIVHALYRFIIDIV